MTPTQAFFQSPLVIWAKTFAAASQVESITDFANGVILNQMMVDIDPKNFGMARVNRLVNNSIQRQQNLELLVENLKNYYQDALHQLVVMKPPNFVAASYEPESDVSQIELQKVLMLILGCAVQSERQEVMIERIKTLPVDVQEALVPLIQEMTESVEKTVPYNTEDSSNLSNEELKNLVQTLTQHLKEVADQRDSFAKNSAQLEHDIEELKGQRTENEENQNASESGQPGTTNGPPSEPDIYQELERNTTIRMLKDELADKTESINDFKDKLARQIELIKKLQQTTKDLSSEAKSARAYRDENDVLREQLFKAEKYKAENVKLREKLKDSEKNKKKVEELREQNTLLIESKTFLEEELNKYKSSVTVDELQAEIRELNKFVDDMSKQRQTDMHTIHNLMEEIGKLEVENEKSKDRLSEANGEIMTLKFGRPNSPMPSIAKECPDVNSADWLKLSKENRQYQEVLAELNECKEKLDELTKKHQEVDRQNIKLNKKNSLQSEEIERLTANLRSDEDKFNKLEVERLNKKVNELKNQLESRDDDNQQIRDELNNWKKKYSTLSDEALELKYKKQELDNEYKQLNDNHEELLNSKNTASERLNVLEQELATLQRANKGQGIENSVLLDELTKKEVTRQEALRENDSSKKKYLAAINEMKELKTSIQELENQLSHTRQEHEDYVRVNDSLRSEVANLEDAAEEYKKTVKSLESKATSLSEELTHKDITIQESTKQIHTLQNKLNKSTEKISELHAKIETVNQDYIQLKREHNHMGIQFNNVKSDNADLEATQEELKRKNNELDMKIALLTDDIASKQLANTELHKQIQLLKDKVICTSQDISELLSKNQDMQREITQLKRALQDEEKRSSNSQSEVADLQTLIDSLKSAKTELENRHVEMMNELNQRQSSDQDSERQADYWKKRHDNIYGDYKELQRKNQELTHDMMNLRKTHQELDRLKTRQQADLTDLLAQLETVKKESKEWQRQNAAAQDDLSVKEAIVEDQQQQLDNYKTKNQEIQRELMDTQAQYQDVLRQSKHLKHSLDELEKKKGNLDEENEALESLNNELRKAAVEQEAELKLLRDECNNNQQGALSDSTQIESLRKRYNDVCNQLAELEGRYNGLTREAAVSKKTIQELERNNANLISDVESNENNYHELNKSMKELEAKNAAYSDDIDHQAITIQDLNDQLSKLKLKNNQLTTELADSQSRIQQQVIDYSRCKNGLQELELNMKNLKENHDELQDENKGLKNQLIDLQAQYYQCNEDINKKDFTIIELTTASDNWKKKFQHVSNELDDAKTKLNHSHDHIASLKANIKELEGKKTMLEAEMANLEIRTQELERSTQDLAMKKEMLEDELQSKIHSHFETSQHIDTLRQKHSQLADELSNLQLTNHQILKENQHLKRTNQDFENDINRRQQELHELEEKNNKLVAKINTLESEIITLNETVNKSQLAHNEVDRYNQTLKDKHHEAAAQVTDLQLKNDELKREIGLLKASQGNIEHQLDQQRSKEVDYHSHVQELERKIKDVETNQTFLQQDLVNKESALQDAIHESDQLSKKIKSTSTNLKEAEFRVEKLTEECNSMGKTLQQLEKSNHNLKMDNSSLQLSLEELKLANIELDVKNSRLVSQSNDNQSNNDKVMQRVDELSQKNIDLEKKNAELRRQLLELQNQVTDLNKTNEDHTDLEKKNAELHRQLLELQNQLDDLNKANGENIDLGKKNAELRRQLLDLQNQLDDLNKTDEKNIDLEKKNTELHQQLLELQNQLDDLSKTSKDNINLEKKNAEFSQQLLALQNQVGDLNKIIKEQQAQLTMLQAIKDENNDLVNKQRNLLDEIEILQNKNDQLSEEIDNVTKQQQMQAVQVNEQINPAVSAMVMAVNDIEPAIDQVQIATVEGEFDNAFGDEIITNKTTLSTARRELINDRKGLHTLIKEMDKLSKEIKDIEFIRKEMEQESNFDQLKSRTIDEKLDISLNCSKEIRSKLLSQLEIALERAQDRNVMLAEEKNSWKDDIDANEITPVHDNMAITGSVLNSSQMSEEIADVEFKARIAALKFMIQKLESEHNVLNGKHQTLHEQNDRLKASFDELRQQFEIVKNEKQQLQHSYDSIQLKERQLADDVIRIKQEKENVQTDYRELYAENNHLKDIYRQLNENYKQLKANYESLQVSYNDLKRHNERLKESSHELEERYDRAKLNLEFAKKQMQTNYINEQSKVDAHTIRQLEDEYNALNSSYGKLKKDFDNLDITAAKVAQRCEMLEQLRLTAYEEIKHLKQHEKVLMERNHKLMQRTLDRKELYMEEHHTYKEAIDKLNRHKEDLEQKLQQFQLDKNKKWDRKIRTLLKSIVKGRKNNDSDGSQVTDGPRRPRREYKASEFATDVESDGGTDESSPRPHRHGRNGSRSLPNTPPSTPKSGSRNNSPTPRRRSRSINRYQNEDQVTPVKRSKSPSSAFKPYRNEKKSEMSPYRQKSSDAHRPSTQNTPHGRSVTPRTRPQPYQERVVSDRDYDSDRRYPNQSNLMVRNGDYRIGDRIGERPVSPNREKSRRLSPTRLQLEIATAESSGSLNSSPSQEINLSNPQSKSPNNSAGLQRVPTFDNLQLGVLPVNQTPGVTESNDLSDSTYPNKDINDETTLKPFNYRDYNRSDSASDINSMPKEEELKLEKYLLESDTSQSQYREKSPRRSRIIHRPQPAVIHNGSLVAHPSSNASSPSYGPSQKGRLKPVMRDNTVRRPSVEGMQAASNTPTPNNHPNRQIGSQAKVPSVSSQSIHQPNYNVGSSYESATLPRNFKAAPIASYGPMKPNTNNRSDDTYESSTLPRNFSFEKHPPGDYSSNNYYPASQQALNSPRNVNYSINKSTGYDRSPHSTATSEASRRGSKHPSKDTTSVNSPRGNYNEGTPSRSPRNYSNQAPLARPDDTKRVSIQVKRSVKR